ncbi:MAG: hypothetical protein RLZZ200_417 [Pseudomonadota bacterium]|jgi:PAS domain S-box-containing protein
MPQPTHENRAELYFQYSVTGIVEADSRGLIFRANPAAQSIIGLPGHRLTGRQFRDLFDPDCQDRLAHHFAIFEEQGIGHADLLLRDAEGSLRDVTLNSVQAGDDLVLHVIDDVTEDRERSRALALARREAEAASEAKGRFLAAVSHELRTPLNAVLGLASLALMTDLTAQQRGYLQQISRSGRGLQQLLNDILDFSKIEAGKLEVEHREVDLFDVLDDVAILASQTAADSPVEVVFDLDPGMPRHLQADPLRLTQVLLNLMGNALKFTARGSVVMSVSQAGGDLRFAIRDTGIGISPEALARLFQPFTQAESDTSRRFGGTGLGLAISRQLARAMGGEVSAESVAGQGSCFTLSLPCVSDEPAATRGGLAGITVHVDARRRMTREGLVRLVALSGGRSVSASTEAQLRILDLSDGTGSIDPPSGTPDGPTLWLTDARDALRLEQQIAGRDGLAVETRPLSPKRLLQAWSRLQSNAPEKNHASLSWVPTEFRGATIAVAEDVAVNRQVIGELLQRAGISVILADDGKALLERLAAAPVPPDLVFMDVHMPLLDGYETTRQLRERGFAGPVIGFSAGAMVEEKARCTDVGMDDFLSKPIDVDELWGTLTRWLPPSPEPASSIPEPAAPPHAPALEPATRRRLEGAGIDVDDALERFLGQSGAMLRALDAFVAQRGNDGMRMSECLARNDRDGLRQCAHGLHGGAAMLGMHALSDVATRIDRGHAGLSREALSTLAGQVADALESIRTAANPP